MLSNFKFGSGTMKFLNSKPVVFDVVDEKKCRPSVLHHNGIRTNVTAMVGLAIITHGLFTLYPLFEVQKRFSRGFFLKILALCMVSI